MTTRVTTLDTLDTVAQWIRDADKVIALTGAGISTDSGIPDFRGPNGIWTKDPEAEKLSHISHYMADPDLRVRAWKLRLEHPAWSAQPGPGHIALASLESKGKLHRLITQNIDGLHQRADSSSEIVIEIHGSIHEVVCMSCEERAPMQRALDRVRAGEADPSCKSCGGILKSATISFGQSLVDEDLSAAQQAAATCDVFLAIGTSLTVYPAAFLPQRALDSGARLIVVNEQPTSFDRRAHGVLRDPIAEVMPALVDLVGDRMSL